MLLLAEHTALNNYLLIQSIRRRRLHQTQDLSTAAGLPHDGHIVRIAAEFSDIVMNPLQRRDKIGNPQIAGIPEFLPILRQIQKPI